MGADQLMNANCVAIAQELRSETAVQPHTSGSLRSNTTIYHTTKEIDIYSRVLYQKKVTRDCYVITQISDPKLQAHTGLRICVTGFSLRNATFVAQDNPIKREERHAQPFCS